MNRAEQIESLVTGHFPDPFVLLGPHAEHKFWTVRAFLPNADEVLLVDEDGEQIARMECLHSEGFFEARIEGLPTRYRLQITSNGESRTIEDPYRFDSPLGILDRYLIGEGSHLHLADTLGASVIEMEGIAGVRFAVWAPNARRVSVVGPFNDWDGRCHPMRLHPDNGVWDIFIPHLNSGELYKFELLNADGQLLPLKADPLARQMEPPPGNASVVCASEHSWGDEQWISQRSKRNALESPMSTYEVHLGSWKRCPEESNRWLNYRELARELVAYALEMGYTHIELLPITEHPFDGSWGYQPIGLFAPTWRFGTPDDFKYFIDQCHQNGIGVILDWVPAHFPKDTHGLANFDGTCLYEHADPRQGEHQDWGTLIYNFGRPEVVNYLVANALWWVNEYHLDGLRVDAVASMLYLDYSREPGEWVPNVHGGNENLEAIAFLKRLNELVHAAGAIVIAEESTSWPLVSRPTWLGGLGFTFKWNMGWMHDTLGYLGEDPVHRTYHHDRMTFGLTYAFTENFVLPLSHDEIVHGKGSMLTRMQGDSWKQFANLRAYYAFMYGYPGKKLLFMGCDFAQSAEWNHNQSLDWDLLGDGNHAGIQRLVRDLNAHHRDLPALHEGDCRKDGFQWIDCSDRDQGVLVFVRRAIDPEDIIIVISHFTPLVRNGYRIGVPVNGMFNEVLNTNAIEYGGSGIGNLGSVSSEHVEAHGQPHSLVLTLPPLATLMLQPHKRNAASPS